MLLRPSCCVNVVVVCFFLMLGMNHDCIPRHITTFVVMIQRGSQRTVRNSLSSWHNILCTIANVMVATHFKQLCVLFINYRCGPLAPLVSLGVPGFPNHGPGLKEPVNMNPARKADARYEPQQSTRIKLYKIIKTQTTSNNNNTTVLHQPYWY